MSIFNKEYAMKLRVKNYFLSSFLMAGLLVASKANANFVMMLDDPNDAFAATIIEDFGVGDLSSAEGVIIFNGMVGAFSVNVTTGISKPIIGPASLDLTSVNVSGAAGQLNIALSDTDFTEPYNSFLASYGGTTFGSVEFDFLHDSSNREFLGDSFAGGSYLSSPGGYAFSSEMSGLVDASAAYSLTIEATITHASAAQVTSFDAVITPVPVPAGGLMLFTSLLGGIFVSRRKKV